VFTNATEIYARRVLEALGVTQMFEGVFHVEFAGDNPKPEPCCYEAVLEAVGEVADRVALIDDTEANLAPAADMGMLTIKLGMPPEDGRHSHLTTLADLPDLLA